MWEMILFGSHRTITTASNKPRPRPSRPSRGRCSRPQKSCMNSYVANAMDTLHTRRQSDILHIPTWPRQLDKTVKEKHEERKSITQTKNSSKHRKIFFYFLSTFFKIFKAEIEVTPCAGMLALEKVVLEARQFQKHLIRYVQGWRVIFSPSHSHCRIVFSFPWMYLKT